MDLALNNQLRLICHKTKTNKQTNKKKTRNNFTVCKEIIDIE